MSLFIKQFYRFGKFTLDTDQRVLLCAGRRLAMPPKVFETLTILVESNGRIVERKELIDRLWPDTFVEEANLTFNIQQLRKFLGDDARHPLYIETIARRGYRFIADVEEFLSDGTEIDGSTTHRFENSEAQSRDVGGDLSGGTSTQSSGPASTWTSRNAPVTAEKKFDALPASHEPTTRVNKRIALAAAVLLIVSGVGLVFWKFSSGLNKTVNENKKTESKFPLPLNLERLTGTGQSSFVAISPDGKYIAYTRNIEKKSEVWLRQLATNTNVEIVPASGVISGLAFTSSGEYLYFVASGPNFVRGDPTNLYRVSMLGGLSTKVIDNLEGNFAISSGDRQIAFIRQAVRPDGMRQYSLTIADSDGRNERVLFVTAHPDDLDAPLWSPDDQSIICSYGNSEGGSQNEGLVKVSLADGTTQVLSSERFFHINKMAWLPDKSGLIISAAKSIADNQLWRVSYPGFEIRQITKGFISYSDLSIAASGDKAVASQLGLISDIWVGSSHEPQNLKKITQAMDGFCWTPNGQLVYSSTASGNRDLWIMQADGMQGRQLTANAKTNGTPAVSSDNRYIVFMSNRTGSFQVWRMNIDGSEQIQLTDGAGKNFPAVSADGKWVFYNTTDDWELWKVSIDGGEPVRLSDYAAAYPAVSPDGKTVACQGRTQSRASLLIFTLEGGRPVKTIDFAGLKPSGFRMQWAPDGKSLIYAVEQHGKTALVKQLSDGGPPQEILGLGGYQLFDFGYSFDGQQLAMTRGDWQRDVVLISDLGQH